MNKNEAYKNVIDNPMSAEAWSSLGKACGWDKKKWIEMGTVNNSVAEQGKVFDESMYNALRFHELNLTTSFEEAVAWLGKVVEG